MPYTFDKYEKLLNLYSKAQGDEDLLKNNPDLISKAESYLNQYYNDYKKDPNRIKVDIPYDKDKYDKLSQQLQTINTDEITSQETADTYNKTIQYLNQYSPEYLEDTAVEARQEVVDENIPDESIFTPIKAFFTGQQQFTDFKLRADEYYSKMLMQTIDPKADKELIKLLPPTGDLTPPEDLAEKLSALKRVYPEKYKDFPDKPEKIEEYIKTFYAANPMLTNEAYLMKLKESAKLEGKAARQASWMYPGADVVNKLSSGIREKIDTEGTFLEGWEKEVGNVTSRPLTMETLKTEGLPKFINTMFAHAGMQSALMSQTMLSRIIGGAIAGGPGSFIAGNIDMSKLETGGFLESAEMVTETVMKDLPDEIIEEWKKEYSKTAPMYGMVSGTIEHLGFMIGAGGQLLRKIKKTPGAESWIMSLIKTLGGSVGEGVEETLQSISQDAYMLKALKEVMSKYPDNQQLKQIVNEWEALEDPLESFKIGASTSFITMGLGKGAVNVRNKYNQRALEKKKKHYEFLKNLQFVQRQKPMQKRTYTPTELENLKHIAEPRDVVRIKKEEEFEKFSDREDIFGEGIKEETKIKDGEMIPTDQMIDLDGNPAIMLSETIEKDDISYTKGNVDVVKTDDGYLILDGAHRVNEAISDGATSIAANVLTKEQAMEKHGDRTPWIEDVIKEEKPKTEDDILAGINKIVIGEGRGTAALKNAISKMNENRSPENLLVQINRMQRRMSHRVDFDTTQLQKEINNIQKRLKEQGYEIVPLKGKEYVDGMIIRAEFRPDETLPEGKCIITQVMLPQINKDGVLERMAYVWVNKGTRELTDAEIKAKEAKELKDKEEIDKLEREMELDDKQEEKTKFAKDERITDLNYGTSAKVTGKKWFATIAKSTKEPGKFQVSYFTNESKQAVADTQEDTFDQAVEEAMETVGKKQQPEKPKQTQKAEVIDVYRAFDEGREDGIFYSKEYVKEYGSKKKKVTLRFSKPYKTQGTIYAIRDIFGEEAFNKMVKEAEEKNIKWKSEDIVKLWASEDFLDWTAKYEKKLFTELKNRGYDGVIIGGSTFVDLDKFDPKLFKGYNTRPVPEGHWYPSDDWKYKDPRETGEEIDQWEIGEGDNKFTVFETVEVVESPEWFVYDHKLGDRLPQKFGTHLEAMRFVESKMEAETEPTKQPEKPIKVFRSGGMDDRRDTGIFLTTKKDTAELYGPDVTEYLLAPNLNLKEATNRNELIKELDPTFDRDGLYNRLIKEGVVDDQTPEMRLQSAIENRIKTILEKQGYDGVKYLGGKTTDQAGEYQIFDKNNILTPEKPMFKKLRNTINVDKNIRLIKTTTYDRPLGKEIRYKIEHKDKEIGYIELTDRGDYYQTGNVNISNSLYRRKGIGTKMYTALYHYLDKPLQSDPSRTKAAEALWDGLVRKGIAVKDESTRPVVYKTIETPMRLFAGTKAKISPQKKQALGKAIKMLEKAIEGKTEKQVDMKKLRKDIWEETGWLRGAEGAWKFEIPDDQFDFKIDPLSVKMHKNKEFSEVLPLNKVILHEKLWKHYKELMNELRIQFIKGLKHEGAYHNGARLIDVKYGMDREQTIDTIIHEIQHAIQYTEGFAIGAGDLTRFELYLTDEQINKFSKYTASQSALLLSQSKTFKDILEHTLKRVREMSDKKIKEYYGYLRSEDHIKAAELLKISVFQQKTIAPKATIPSNVVNERTYLTQNIAYAIQEEIQNIDWYTKAVESFKNPTEHNRRHRARLVSEVNHLTLYFDTAGEHEARSAARRRRMTQYIAGQREYTPFAEDNMDDWIVIYDDDSPNSLIVKNIGGQSERRNTVYMLQDKELQALKKAAAGIGVDMSQAKIADKIKNTKETILADKWAELLTGNKIIWLDDLQNTGAVHYDNRIFMSSTHSEPVIEMTLHESIHQIGKDSPEDIKRLYSAIKEELVKNGYSVKKVEQYFKNLDYLDSQIPHEVCANYIAAHYRDKAFWERIMVRVPDVVIKIIQKIKQFINQSWGKLTANERDLITNKLTNEQNDRLLDIAAEMISRHINSRVAKNRNIRKGINVPDKQMIMKIIEKSNELYSQMERAVARKFPKSMKTQSIMNWLKKYQVKPTEIDAIGIEQWLEGKDRVTKEELQEFIRNNKVTLKTIIKGGDFLAREFEQIKEKEKAGKIEEEIKFGGNTYTYIPIEDMLEIDPELDLALRMYPLYRDVEAGDFLVGEDLQYRLTKFRMDYGSSKRVRDIVRHAEKQLLTNRNAGIEITASYETKYSQYQEPGGENYREVLFTLPIKILDLNLEKTIRQDINGKYYTTVDIHIMPWKYDTKQEALNNAKKWTQNTGFKSIHWDEPNPAVHIRLNDRTDSNGNKILFIEEIQSDWAQKGNKKGFQNQEMQNVIYELKAERKELAEKLYGPKKEGLSRQAMQKLRKKESELGYEIGELEKAQSEIPDMPFKGDEYMKLALKQILRMAVAQGYDKIAWTTPQQQIDRYNEALRQNVDTIEWEKTPAEKVAHTKAEVKWMKKAYEDYRKSLARKYDTPVERIDLGQYISAAEERKLSKLKDAYFAIEDRKVETEFYRNKYETFVQKMLDKYDSQVLDAIVDDMTTVERMRLKVLSKQKKEAKAMKNRNTVTISASKNGNESFREVIPLEGEVTIHNKKVTLEDVVGKNLAKQIKRSNNKKGRFEGDDLSIGGQGMHAFYGEMMPNYLKKYTKKWKGKVGSVDFADKGAWVATKNNETKTVYTYGEMKKLKKNGWKINEDDSIKPESPQIQPSLTITPKMKEAIPFGQPMFIKSPGVNESAILDKADQTRIEHLKAKDIKINPRKYQFRADVSKEGIDKRMKGVKYKPGLSQMIVVLQKKNGDYYVINGHHRVALAKSDNPNNVLTANVLSYKNFSDEEAIVYGALINISEGHANPIDVAKALRSGMIKRETIEAYVSTKLATRRDGLALADLHDGLFQELTTGKLRLKRAVILGEMLPNNKEAQVQALRAARRKKNKFTDAVLKEVIAAVKATPMIESEQTDLFGTRTLKSSLIVEKGEIIAYAKKELVKRKSVLSAVNKSKNRDFLQDLGNKLTEDINLGELDNTQKLMVLVDKLAYKKGNAINRILNNEAVRYQKSRNKDKVKKNALDKIIEAIDEGLEEEDIEKITAEEESEAYAESQQEDISEIAEEAKKIPPEFRKKVNSEKLAGSGRRSKLFGLLGNKAQSVALFNRLYTQWTESGVRVILEPYAGAYTLGTHALKNAIEAGLKEYHANVFDKEKYIVIEAIKKGKAEEIITTLSETITKMNDKLIAAAEKHPIVKQAFAEFTEQHPDSFIGSNAWKDFVLRETNYEADAINYKDIYEEFRKVFQDVIDDMYIERTDVKTLKQAVELAFINATSVMSGKGQRLISGYGFKAFENIVLGEKYGMVAAVRKTAEVMAIAKDNNAQIHIHTKDGAEFLKLIDKYDDKSRLGIYLDPPYIESAVRTYKDQSVDNPELLSKFIVPKEYIDSHQSVFEAERQGAKIALTNDDHYGYIKQIDEIMNDPGIFIYKEHKTHTSLITDNKSQETVKQYFADLNDKRRGKSVEVAEDPEVTKEKSNIRRLIHIISSTKGITKAEIKRITKKYTGHVDMSGVRNKKLITIEQYQKILDHVKKQAPRRGKRGEIVIPQKLESRIQQLKAKLINDKAITQDQFKDIVVSITGKSFFEPRWIHRNKYVTRSEGRQIVKLMNETAEAHSQEIAINEALEEKQVIKERVDRITKAYNKEYSKQDLEDISTGVLTHFEMRHIANALEKYTGKPFGRAYHEMIAAYKEAQKEIAMKIDGIHEDIDVKDFRTMIHNAGSLERIENFIASQLPKYFIHTPEKPADITPEEKKVAKAMQETLKDFETDVRFFRFLEYYDQFYRQIDEFSAQTIKQTRGEWIPNAPVGAVKEAVRILETEGTDSLYRWMRTQTWGVIRSGYDIGEAVKPKLVKSDYKVATVKKGMLRARTKVEYSDKERDIITRFNAYVRQMTLRKRLLPYTNRWQSLINSEAHKIKNGDDFIALMHNNLIELLGRHKSRSDYVKVWFKVYAQAARVIFSANPKMFVRNLVQSTAFYLDNFKTLQHMPKKMTKAEKEFFDTHVVEMTGITQDLLFQKHDLFNDWSKQIDEYAQTREGDKALKVLKKHAIKFGASPVYLMKYLNAFADKANSIGISDTINRIGMYKQVIGQIKAAMKSVENWENTSSQFAKLLKKIGFSDLTTVDRKTALEILALEGKQAFINDVALQKIKRVHRVYDRYERSPHAQGSDIARLLSNLMVFPHGYVQNQALDTQKLKKIERELAADIGGTSRAVASIFYRTILGAVIAGSIYQVATGDDDRNPYSFVNIALGFSLGGIATAAPTEFFGAMSDMLQGIGGDEYAQKRFRRALPKVARMFLPGLKLTVQIIEAVWEKEHIDYYFVKKILGEIEPKIENYDRERSTMEAVKHALFGTDPKTFEERFQEFRRDIKKSGLDEVSRAFWMEELQYQLEIEKITPKKYDSYLNRMNKANSEFEKSIYE